MVAFDDSRQADWSCMGHTDCFSTIGCRCDDRNLSDQKAIDGAAFAAYVEKVLVTELSSGTVVILDNRATLKMVKRNRRCAGQDAGDCFLVRGKRAIGPFYDPSNPDSPDLNPIELSFSKLKAPLRRIESRNFTDMFNAIRDICDIRSPQDCCNSFRAAGYVPRFWRVAFRLLENVYDRPESGAGFTVSVRSDCPASLMEWVIVSNIDSGRDMRKNW